MRRTSGRFAPAAASHRAPLIGFAMCVLMVPLALSATRRRPPSDKLVRATSTPIAVRLADSSHVTLETGSALRYDPRFANRRLWLVGSASIRVVPGKPYAVWTETAVLRTSGATFDVRTAGLETTYVFVRDGSVQLRAMNEDNDPAYPAVSVGAGQNAVAAKMVGAWLVAPRK